MWCDDERCVSCVEITQQAPYNKYMVGDEWLLQYFKPWTSEEVDVAAINEEYENENEDENEYEYDSERCDDIVSDTVVEAESASTESNSESDSESDDDKLPDFEWLFVNHKSMYT